MLTTISTKKESRFNEHLITNCLFSTTRFISFPAAFFVDSSGSFDDAGKNYDVGDFPLDDARRELPHYSTIFCDGFAVARIICRVL